tara:strand:- start:1991 stop:2425 length:435 start_codon:yes stop_codon:yes gene_type:complete
MYKYYIPEININNLNHKKIKKHSKSFYNNFLITLNGKYIIENDKVKKNYIMDYDSEDYNINDYLDMSITLLVSKMNWKYSKSSEIPNNNYLLKSKVYDLKKDSVIMKIEYLNDNIYDLYFLSDLEYNNNSFKEDISYLLTKFIF